MTIEQYNKATKILEEKSELEEALQRIRGPHTLDFSNIEDYLKICERLFILGGEFAAL